jgi:hypothetical protein
MEENTSVLIGNELIRLASPFAQLINSQFTGGEKLEDVVSAGLFAFGCALAQIGHHINVAAPINVDLKPLAIGYTESITQVKKTRMM